jgi:hypothetical protein
LNKNGSGIILLFDFEILSTHCSIFHISISVQFDMSNAVKNREAGSDHYYLILK